MTVVNAAPTAPNPLAALVNPADRAKAFRGLDDTLAQVLRRFLEALGAPFTALVHRFDPLRVPKAGRTLYRSALAVGGGVEVCVYAVGSQNGRPAAARLLLRLRLHPASRWKAGVIEYRKAEYADLWNWWSREGDAFSCTRNMRKNVLAGPSAARMHDFLWELASSDGSPSPLDVPYGRFPEIAQRVRPIFEAVARNWLDVRGRDVREVERTLGALRRNDPPDAVARSAILERKEVVRHLLAAMLTRPLVLLAGVSGSGKTQLACRVGNAWSRVPRLVESVDAGAADGAALLERVAAALNVLHDVGDGYVEVDEPRPEATPTDAEEDDDGEDEQNDQIEQGEGDDEEEDERTAEAGRADAPDTDGEDSARAAPPPHPRFALVPVRPDWQEAGCLWGFYDPLSKEFAGTPALRVVLDAWDEWTRLGASLSCKVSYVLVLDEMNLSRIEHYGSDLLSAMEHPGERIIHLHNCGKRVRLAGAPDVRVPASIGWAPGLTVIGTVNVDETTFSFAPKVLDRAAVLEFREIDLPRVFSLWKRDDQWARLREWFGQVQAALEPHALHLGYRAAREIADAAVVRFGETVASWPADGPFTAFLDFQLRNKVLPRVRGPRGTAEPVLVKLLALALGKPLADIQSVVDRGWPADEVTALTRGATYPEAARKASEMLARLLGVGFTGFFG